MIGWQSKHDLINLMTCWISALHRALYNEGTHDIEVLRDPSQYGCPYVGRTKSMFPCNFCRGGRAGSYVDRNRVRQRNNLFVVCSDYTILNKGGDYLKHYDACENCYLEEKYDGKKPTGTILHSLKQWLASTKHHLLSLNQKRQRLGGCQHTARIVRSARQMLLPTLGSFK